MSSVTPWSPSGCAVIIAAFLSAVEVPVSPCAGDAGALCAGVLGAADEAEPPQAARDSTSASAKRTANSFFIVFSSIPFLQRLFHGCMMPFYKTACCKSSFPAAVPSFFIGMPSFHVRLPQSLVYQNPERSVRAAQGAVQNILLGKLCQQNLPLPYPLPVIGHIDVSVWPFLCVGVGRVIALIQQKGVGPGGAVVLAEHGGQVGPATPAFHISLGHNVFQIDPLPEVCVVDHQQPARTQAADVKSGAGSIDMGFLPRGPGLPAVKGEALPDAVKGPHQHPKGPILFFNQHMFVKAPVGHIPMAAQRNMPALVRRGIDIRELFGLQAMTLGGKRPAFIPPDRAGEQPIPL